jgi:hypothetical protein
MSYTGTIENGVVKLPPEAHWPDGTAVRVEKIAAPRSRNQLTQRLREIAAKLDGLPPDLAEQHDHYIHGTPKRPRT